MRPTRDLLLTALVLGISIGCGGSDAPQPAATAAVNGVQSAADLMNASEGVPEEPIARVVYEFLDAMRRGDAAGISQRLTPLALERAQETDSPILPPGSDTARFKVGNSELVGPDKAVVDSVWTDLDVDGKPSDEAILWALRLCDGQWKVSGMMADMGPGAEPVTINFEDPDAMGGERPVDSRDLAGAGTPQETEKAGSSVARNPFEQSSQR